MPGHNTARPGKLNPERTRHEIIPSKTQANDLTNSILDLYSSSSAERRRNHQISKA
jgi:hypothetical protein